MKREQFIKIFNEQLEALKSAERVTRGVLKAMSRQLLMSLHGSDDALLLGDIQYVNAVLPHLSPVNRKAYVAFMKHFTGFHYDEGESCFTKKSKKRYMDCKATAEKHLADPNFNIWSWAERHIEVTVKPFTDDKITDYMKGAIKKMAGDQSRVLRAVVAAGITPAAIMVILDEMTKADDGEPRDAVVGELNFTPEEAPF